MIRTRSNYLLGPVSKDKILELIENGSIHPDDEICSGNGYWFYLKESDLVKKYIYSDQEQDFNLVSEALNDKEKREMQEVGGEPTGVMGLDEHELKKK